MKIPLQPSHTNKMNQDFCQECVRLCDCCMKEWNNDADPEDMCHCCCSRCYGLLRDCQYNCTEDDVEEEESEDDIEYVEDDNGTDNEDDDNIE